MYALKFIQKEPCNDESDHLFTYIYKFYSPDIRLHYVLRAEYHSGCVFTIKFSGNIADVPANLSIIARYRLMRDTDFCLRVSWNPGPNANITFQSLSQYPPVFGAPLNSTRFSFFNFVIQRWTVLSGMEVCVTKKGTFWPGCFSIKSNNRFTPPLTAPFTPPFTAPLTPSSGSLE